MIRAFLNKNTGILPSLHSSQVSRDRRKWVNAITW
jgi:hypothetical protein